MVLNGQAGGRQGWLDSLVGTGYTHPHPSDRLPDTGLHLNSILSAGRQDETRRLTLSFR